jgi:uncharacterized protein (DUF1778 family)
MNTKKDTTIKIRITSQEKNELLKATAHKQQKTMSNILREAIVKNNENTTKEQRKIVR